MDTEVVTFTANPSLDRTIELSGPLCIGAVQRAAAVTEQAGGKGLNVARVLMGAGRAAVAVAPAVDASFRRLAALAPAVPLVADDLPTGRRVRINTAITEPDGTTTKVNESGPALTTAAAARAEESLAGAVAGARWAVLSGSLPPGAPTHWYANLSRAAAAAGALVAVDTSGAPLTAVVSAVPAARIDLLKPNAEELAHLAGGDGDAFEAAALRGEVDGIVAAARRLVRAGIGAVLVSLGAAGAALVTQRGAWFARAPRITVRSTVGAGDSSVAGYVLAHLAGGDESACLASAIGYGAAAAALPGTTLPTPDDVAAQAPQVVAVA